MAATRKPNPTRRKPAAKNVPPTPPTEPQRAPFTPLHQWTHDVGKVRILKCVDAEMRARGEWLLREADLGVEDGTIVTIEHGKVVTP